MYIMFYEPLPARRKLAKVTANLPVKHGETLANDLKIKINWLLAGIFMYGME